MRAEPFQNNLGIGAVKHASKKPVIMDAVGNGDRPRAFRRCINWFEPFLVQHDSQIVQSATAQTFHRPPMGQKHKMHRTGGGAYITQPRRMDANEMGQVGYAPRFIDGGDVAQPVAKPFTDQFSKISKMMRDVGITPAPHIRHPLRQLPVIEGTERLQVARQHGVYQPVIKIEPFGIWHARPVWEYTRPVCREPIAFHMGIPDKIEILFIAQIMFTGAGAILAIHNISPGCGKAVPVTGTRPAKRLSFDLVGSGGSAKQKAVWQIGTGKFHCGHGAVL